MPIVRVAVSFILMGAGQLLAQPPAASPFKPLEFLVGSCWIGEFPGGTQTDRHCFEWVYDGKFIRDRHVVPGAKPYQGESLYRADPKTGQVSYSYWSSEGLFVTGTVEPSGDSLIFPSRYATPKGEVELKAIWIRTPNGYRVSSLQKSASQWKELWTMEMRRDGASPHTP